MTQHPHTLPIEDRLRATKAIVVDFDMIECTTTTEDRLINPDGPKAAGIIAALYGALEVCREALRNHACHAGLAAPCLRTEAQCRNDCGKDAGNAFVHAEAALSLARGEQS